MSENSVTMAAEVGRDTTERLHKQTRQMNRALDELDATLEPLSRSQKLINRLQGKLITLTRTSHEAGKVRRKIVPEYLPSIPESVPGREPVEELDELLDVMKHFALQSNKELKLQSEVAEELNLQLQNALVRTQKATSALKRV